MSDSREVWARAEAATENIIRQVQPNVVSEERRRDVIVYVQKLLQSCLGCEVFPFGSVPLKTYLPDGDVDLTAFCDLYFEEACANDVYSVLEAEQRNLAAKFAVKDVQYICAEVKLVKCLVQNVVVDISFNQIGGLSALCFLEEIDRQIGKDHLYKRSIILIKAWCFYESRTLGAHHGLISTYALEIMILYIFHVFHSSLNGPFAVLHKFLDYFSKFDWENFCVSLSGPVHIASLPKAVARKPEASCRELLLSDDFMRECVNKFAVPSRVAEINYKFMRKHLNIVDPLNKNNNLGRSVYKGNFFRIRSAFSYGARKLGEILLQPLENITEEVPKLFTNVLNIHGKGQRAGAPEHMQLSSCNELTSEILLPVTEPYQDQFPTYEDDSIYADSQSSGSREDSEEVTIGGHKKSGKETSIGTLSYIGSSEESSASSRDENDLATSGVQGLMITEQSDDFFPSIAVNKNLPYGDFPNAPHFRSHHTFENGKLENGFLHGTMENEYLNGKIENSYINGMMENGYSNGKMGNGCSAVTGRHDTVNTLTEFSGDVDCNLINLHYARWWYSNRLSIPLQPTPLVPPMFQPNASWDVKNQRVTHMNVNGVIPGPAFFTFNHPAACKPRGLGTYFPIVKHPSYTNRPSSKRRSRKSKSPQIHGQAQDPFRQGIGRPEITDNNGSFLRGMNYKKANGFVQPLAKVPTSGAEVYSPLESDQFSENQSLGPIFGVDDSRFSVKPYQLKDEDFPPLYS